jgi:hypothetical protein
MLDALSAADKLDGGAATTSSLSTAPMRVSSSGATTAINFEEIDLTAGKDYVLT